MTTIETLKNLKNQLEVEHEKVKTENKEVAEQLDIAITAVWTAILSINK
jgi:hypothetical protein